MRLTIDCAADEIDKAERLVSEILRGKCADEFDGSIDKATSPATGDFRIVLSAAPRNKALRRSDK